MYMAALKCVYISGMAYEDQTNHREVSSSRQERRMAGGTATVNIASLLA